MLDLSHLSSSIHHQILQIIMVTTLTSIPKDFETEATKLSIEYAQNIEVI